MSDAITGSAGDPGFALTREEEADFARRLRAFRQELPPRQGEAFDSIMQAASGGGDDVQGFWIHMGSVWALYQHQQVQQEADDIGELGTEIFGPDYGKS